MLEQLQAMTTAIETGSSSVVNLWVNWMMIIFFLSVLFVWRHKAARYALAAMLLTVPAALVIYNLSGSIHLIGLAHIFFWTPLFYYLVTREIRRPAFSLRSPYGIWVTLLAATILISLIFDVRDTFLVLSGQK